MSAGEKNQAENFHADTGQEEGDSGTVGGEKHDGGENEQPSSE